LFWLGYGALALALALVFLHMVVGRRYLSEYVAVYHRLPGWDWLLTGDEDSTVERWRRRRLAVVIPEMLLFLIGIVIILNAPV
jgi:hypothetical protein